MKSIRLILMTTLLCGIIASCKDKTDVTPDDGAAVAANPDWTTESHSNDVDPNYDIVFPQNQVNTLEITMTATDWNSIKTDMQTKSGTAFGAEEEIRQGEIKAEQVYLRVMVAYQEAMPMVEARWI